MLNDVLFFFFKSKTKVAFISNSCCVIFPKRSSIILLFLREHCIFCNALWSVLQHMAMPPASHAATDKYFLTSSY